MSAQSKAQFLEWMQRNEPAIYAAAVAMTPKDGGVSGWLDDIVSTIQTAAPKIADVAAKVAPTVLNYKLQKEQVKRAQQAQPPIDMNAYTLTALQTVQKQAQRAEQGLPPAPTPNYQPVVAPAVPVQNFPEKVAAKAANENMPLLLGAAALAAILLLKK